eukprot:gnl/Chilomastix_cuspidata/2476.p2 GENE.gnl/Chilomastix_cuspidata/2476~~gnl/Chilomastix_cuspidata/2476.p2  ORF type:complete len:219 (-),score=72.18 gnl/Chilomastix_cuspidata/2476:42-698(-)
MSRLDRSDWGQKTGGGGVAPSYLTIREREKRLEQMARETYDLSNDPFLFKNHLGTYECKLCFTRHKTEASYVAHTLGKKHLTNIRKYQIQSQKGKGADGEVVAPVAAPVRRAAPRIGRPGYRVVKQRDPATQQLGFLFELEFLRIAKGKRPEYRIMSAFEQRVEPPDPAHQFVVFAAEPYETVAFKIPNVPVDRARGHIFTRWDPERRLFQLQFFFEK